jgi:hypothetical protein
MEAEVTLAAGWHSLEIDSYHTASNPSLQFSWQQPDSGREVVRPETLATDLPPLVVTERVIGNWTCPFGRVVPVADLDRHGSIFVLPRRTLPQLTEFVRAHSHLAQDLVK